METQLGAFPAEWERPVAFTQTAGGNSIGIFGDDGQLNVRFVLFPEINEFKTQAAGYKVIEHKEYVHVQRPGDKWFIYFQPAREVDKARFPLQYRAFKEGRTEKLGIHLPSWDYQLSETELASFKLLGIEYVHQIAAMTDVQMQSLGAEAAQIVARAKISVAEEVEKATAATLQQKLDGYEKQMSSLRDENEQIRKILESKGAAAAKEESVYEKAIAQSEEQRRASRRME